MGRFGPRRGHSRQRQRMSAAGRKFVFAFQPSYARVARLFGVTQANTHVVVTGTTFEARYGPWKVSTPLTNITSAQLTGPYSYLKTAGPAHYSFADHGLTFATNGRQGVCLEFRLPISGAPFGLVHHPNLTVTVADGPGLIAAVTAGQQSDE